MSLQPRWGPSSPGYPTSPSATQQWALIQGSQVSTSPSGSGGSVFVLGVFLSLAYPGSLLFLLHLVSVPSEVERYSISSQL
jgi:hypothetical protein